MAKLKLHRSQADALKLVARYAKRQRAESLREIEHVLKMTNVPPALFEAAQREIFQHARPALHFHPDRPCQNGKSAAQNLLADGVYKSQFETFMSAGSVSAHKGGLRYKREKRLFHNAYNKWGVKAEYRPKYGALDLTLQADGPSPRFGSCFFLLKSKTLKRCTFTYLDSFTFPKAKGTVCEFHMIFAALLMDLFQHRAALGKKDVTVREFLESLLDNLSRP
ncbi:MAG TPA: DUF3626 domain-containing protein, partial [Firmicutes bacterium]|nr:DUF3626 domain-containing protein [Bacillota bacterium]